MVVDSLVTTEISFSFFFLSSTHIYIPRMNGKQGGEEEPLNRSLTLVMS